MFITIIWCRGCVVIWREKEYLKEEEKKREKRNTSKARFPSERLKWTNISSVVCNREFEFNLIGKHLAILILSHTEKKKKKKKLTKRERNKRPNSIDYEDDINRHRINKVFLHSTRTIFNIKQIFLRQLEVSHSELD